MKIKNSLKKLPLLLLFGTSLLGWSQAGQAVKITAFPGQAIELDLADPADADDTGVKILNREQIPFDVEIELLANDPVLNLPTPDGFVLLDNTLRVTSTNPAGKRRIRIRMDFGRYLRAGRLAGIRAGSIRLLRANERFSGRWLPAVRRINEQRIADIRYLRTLEDDDFVLGHHGIDLKRQFAWAITDTGGTQYFAIGGVAVPLPAAWLLFLSGSGLLLMVSRNRRKPVIAQ